jgi:hypothetical protein
LSVARGIFCAARAALAAKTQRDSGEAGAGCSRATKAAVRSLSPGDVKKVLDELAHLSLNTRADTARGLKLGPRLDRRRPRLGRFGAQ